MTDIAKAKSKFRRTSKWLNFRRKLKVKRKCDELTLRPLLSGWNLHHLCMKDSNYFNISDESLFACLNKQSHKVVHFIYTYYSKDPSIIDRLKDILERMKEANK